MIIFYDKKTGEIKGTIEGRIHPESHLKMWVGDKKDNGRLIVNWKPVKEEVEVPVRELRVTESGRTEKVIVGHKKEMQLKKYVPDCDFPDILNNFETGKDKVYNYSVVLKDGKVINFKKIK